MTRRTFFVGILLTVVWTVVLISPEPAEVQTLALPGCHVEAHAANAGGTRIDCKGSEWLGAVDYQCGVYVPGDRKKLNCNVGAGNRHNPGYVVLVADVGKGVLVTDGESKPHKLLVLRNRKYGRSEFRTRIYFEKGLIACDRRGCINVMTALRRR